MKNCVSVLILMMILQGCGRNKCYYSITKSYTHRVELAREYIGREGCYVIGGIYRSKSDLYIRSYSGGKDHDLIKKPIGDCVLVPAGSLFRFKGVYHSSNEVIGTIPIGIMSLCDGNGKEIVPWCEISMNSLCKELADYTVDHSLFEEAVSG